MERGGGEGGGGGRVEDMKVFLEVEENIGEGRLR